MKAFFAKYGLVLLLAVMLLTASWQYWQIKNQAVVQAVPNPIYGGCKSRSFNDCAGCVDDKTACKWDHKTQTCKEKSAPNGCGAGGLNVDNKCPAGCTIDSDKKNLYERCIGGEWCTVVARKCDGGSAKGSKGEKCELFWAVGTKGENCRPDPKCESKPRVSPSASPSSSLSPSPYPSPQTEQGWIRVRKFHDRNQNGVKDWNEVATGHAWPFQYQIANGPWQDYTTNAFTGVGPAVKVPANSQITVKEIVLGGWINSTAVQLSELVTNNEVQWFTFGNYRTSGPEPSPSSSPSPSPSATPVPTPEPDEASFVIRKFKDDDKDGYWDNNETATGQYWQFHYRLNSDDWQSYQTDPSSGWGGLVTVGLDTKIEVKEETVSGWVNTTGLTQIKILDESKVYYFDFGNFAEPETVEASVPPTVPAAGIGFSLWPLGVAAAAGLVLQLLALLL